MRYLPLVLLGPTLLVLVWLYWTFPKGSASRGRRVYDAVVIVLTLSACVMASLWMDASAPLSAAGALGRQSGQIWAQVRPALCGYGISIAVLAAGLLVRRLVWRQGVGAPGL